MPHQGHRRTSSDKRKRAAHFALKKTVLGVCEKCSQPVRPHHACKNCGSYRGKNTMDVSRQTERQIKRAQEKKAASAPAPEPKKEKETK